MKPSLQIERLRIWSANPQFKAFANDPQKQLEDAIIIHYKAAFTKGTRYAKALLRGRCGLCGNRHWFQPRVRHSPMSSMYCNWGWLMTIRRWHRVTWTALRHGID